jgi:membrane protein
MSLASNPESRKTQQSAREPLSRRVRLKELFRRVRRDIVWHDSFGKAAELAFFFQLAIFPLLIFLLSLISFIPEAQQIILFWLGRLMPAEATEIVEEWVRDVISRRSRGILSFSLIFSLWSASTGVRTLISALNRAYEVEEGRPFWKSQLLALGLTLALCVLVIGGVLIITFGDQLITAMGAFLGFAGSVETLWRAFHYMIGLLMLIVGTGLIYYLGPNVKQDWRSIMPGSLFAVIAFIVVSYLFSVYIRYAPSYSAVYGSLGAFIILMLWLYLMALILYVGGEINSEVRKLSGKPPPQRE